MCRNHSHGMNKSFDIVIDSQRLPRDLILNGNLTFEFRNDPRQAFKTVSYFTAESLCQLASNVRLIICPNHP